MKYHFKEVDGVQYWSKRPDDQLKNFALVVGTIFVFTLLAINFYFG
jgi:hypothetical protein